jgi:Protein of unknown function (DUF2934)
MSTMNRLGSTLMRRAPLPSIPREREIAPRPAVAAGTEALIDRVRSRAYEIYQTRSCYGVPGDALSDWLQAEREVIDPESGRFAPCDVEVKYQMRGESLLTGVE